MRRVLIVAALLALGAPAVRVRADPPAPPAAPAALTAADREFFAWWDARGFPDVKTLPFVRVWAGHWSKSGSHDPVPEVSDGFLVSEEGSRFTVFQTDLE